VLEFVELYDGGVGNSSLANLVLVFYNGNGDVSYNAFDLDGFSTNAEGYFLLGNSGVVPTPSIIFSSNGLQNGADAVALYSGDAADFPNGTAVTTTDLTDAIVYDTDDSDDAGLLVLLNVSQPQVNENMDGNKDTQSLQRAPDASGGARNTNTYIAAAPTPGGENPLPIQLSSFTGIYISANSVQLDWITITEVNNYGFFVERRSVNEQNFVELPNSFITGHGTTLIPHHYTYADNSAHGETWYYRLRQVDLDGSVHYTDQILVSTVTSVSHEVPAEFSLHQNYPNPFNPSTIIRFSVETQGLATLTLYNLLGQEITTLFSGTVGPQQLYSVRLDGSTLPTGTYFYSLESGDWTSLKKMILSK